MDDALAVRRVERVRDLGRRTAAPARAAERPASQTLRERFALEKLHHEVVDLAFARRRRRGRRCEHSESLEIGTGLALEALPHLGRGGEVWREDLDRVKLFENDLVVALDKPAGVSMATSTREEKSAARAVERLLKACGEDPGEPLLLVHRLDVGTSGVVLLAKSDEAHRALSRGVSIARREEDLPGARLGASRARARRLRGLAGPRSEGRAEDEGRPR